MESMLVGKVWFDVNSLPRTIFARLSLPKGNKSFSDTVVSFSTPIAVALSLTASGVTSRRQLNPAFIARSFDSSTSRQNIFPKEFPAFEPSPTVASKRALCLSVDCARFSFAISDKQDILINLGRIFCIIACTPLLSLASSADVTNLLEFVA